ncbi:MAG: NADH-quinone oxidoreductase subunit C [Pseudomonadota bacterium]
MSARILERLRERFGEAVLDTHSFRGDDTAVVAAARILEVAEFLRDEPSIRLDMPVDLTVVDWLAAGREPRFEVVYHFYSTVHKHRLRIKCPLPQAAPSIASVYPVYPGLRWFEREAWDLFGVEFEGHPDLRRMFLPESFVGHPLRKDYPKDKRQPLSRREGMC